MTWYKIVLEQEQPIYIGYKRYGVLAETRIFIPGQTMWGALTKAYNLMKENSLNSNQELFEQITCFYPSFDKENILKPNFKNRGFHLGDLSEKEFRLLFVDSFISTAILPETRTAKDGSLHEIEFILPKPKKALENTELWKKITEVGYKNENLKWIGLVCLNDDSLKDELENLKIFIGGDVRYGYGLMKVMKVIKIAEDNILEEFNVKNNKITKGKMINPSGKRSLNYLEFNPTIKFEGKLELLPEFDFYNKRKITNAKYYIIPGSKII